MKIYICMNALPWEKLSINIPDPSKDDGSQMSISPTSSDERAGFVPIFWTQEAAEKAYPGYQVLEGDVPDDWHPKFPSKPEVEEEVAD